MIPIFRQQIEKGGSVTVTHPDIVRFFGTIPGAVSLVTLAGVCTRGREIFVLDRVSPMKIDALAQNLIQLSGYRPDGEIRNWEPGIRDQESGIDRDGALLRLNRGKAPSLFSM